MALHFRRGTAADVPALIPMVVAQYALHAAWDAAKFAPRPDFEKGYARWLAARATDPRSVLFVAEVETDAPAPAVLAGFIVATTETEIPVYLTRDYGFLHELFVQPDYRNEGAARQLVTLTVEAFRDLGVTQVRCEAAWLNGPARGLFQRCGFREVAITLIHGA